MSSWQGKSSQLQPDASDRAAEPLSRGGGAPSAETGVSVHRGIVGVSVGVRVGVGVALGVTVSVGVGVSVGVSDGVSVTDGVSVMVGVLDGVNVGVGV